MFQSLTLFRQATALARHAGLRQAIVAQNMANADTPGYAALRVAPFDPGAAGGTGAAPTRRRPGHLFDAPGTRPDVLVAQMTTDPNGNSVSIEEELVSSVNAKRQHDRALAIYRSGMTILRASINQR